MQIILNNGQYNGSQYSANKKVLSIDVEVYEWSDSVYIRSKENPKNNDLLIIFRNVELIDFCHVEIDSI